MVAHSTRLLLEQLQQDIDAGHHRVSQSTAGRLREEARQPAPEPEPEPLVTPQVAQAPVVPQASAPAAPRTDVPDVAAFVQGVRQRRGGEIDNQIESALRARFGGKR